MKTHTILLLLAFSFSLLVVGCARRSSSPARKPFDGPPRIGNALKPKFPPQAAPIVFLLKACKRNRLVLLQRASSKRLHRILNDYGWCQQLDFYQKMFIQLVGKRYVIRDFSYRYEGSEEQGLIIAKYGWNELPALRVIFEDGSWKFDGR